MMCVNKRDINPPLAEVTRGLAEEMGLRVAGEVRYDPAVTEAMLRGQSITEYTETGASEDLHALWECVSAQLAASAQASEVQNKVDGNV